MLFSENILDQQQVREVLTRAIEHEKIAHGYIFSGPPGTGKFLTALEFARVLNCKHFDPPNYDSNCTCESCQNMRKLYHPNLLYMFPLPPDKTKKGEEEGIKLTEENLAIKSADPYAEIKMSPSGQILVKQIRTLRNKMSLAQDRKGTRFSIVQPAERMNKSSANALLKLLEEPPEQCCMILITSSVRRLLPTIASRCQILRFSTLSSDTIRQSLMTRFSVAEDEADQLSRLADGSYATALQLMEEGVNEKLSESLDFLRAAVVGNAPKLSLIIDSWVRLKSRHEIVDRLSYVSRWIKDSLIIQAYGIENAKDLVSSTGNIKVTAKIGNLYAKERLLNTLSFIENTKQELDSNVMEAASLTSLAIHIRRVFK